VKKAPKTRSQRNKERRRSINNEPENNTEEEHPPIKPFEEVKKAPKTKTQRNKKHRRSINNEPENTSEEEYPPRKPFEEVKKAPKTKTQRNKERAKRVALAIYRKKRAEEKRNRALDHLDIIKARLDELEQARATAREIVNINRTRHQLYGAKRLGKEKYEKHDTDVLLPHELPSRMSRLHYSRLGLLWEHQNRLCQRNIIETRSAKTLPRRYPRKYMERYDYKVYNREQEQLYGNLGKE